MKIAATLLTLATCAWAAPFEIKDGDRVLLLGDALLERENTYGLLETRMHEQFPNVKFTVRNLSWSGETPKGWSRASFDGPEKGWERLKEQIAEVKPTVAILGFGMAASLQEMTDRSGDQTLNPDPVRYGAEPMNAGRFKRELAELMDAINERTPDKKPARFVLLSPIQHEDLRNTRPGVPDPAPHNRLLTEYSAEIQKLGEERGALYIQSELPFHAIEGYLTDNGVQLNQTGYSELAHKVAQTVKGLRDERRVKQPPADPKHPTLTAAILRKNDLFFHQFRPANSTYLFGFRKHEQGKNAAEMPKFTPLIDAADAEIDRLKRQSGDAQTAPASKAPAAPYIAAAAKDDTTPLPLPNFTVADGFELTLWADTHLVGKPVGMNWDAQGRLWVACSPVYPQIEPGAHPHDKVVVLEDSDHDGKADKTTTFATDLLIAAGVAPDFGTATAANPTANAQEQEAALVQKHTAAKKENKAARGKPINDGVVDNPEQEFVDAFLLFRKAEGKEAAGDTKEALNLLRDAKARFERIQAGAPRWNPRILEFRIDRTAQAIERLTPKQTPAGSNPSAGDVAATRAAKPSGATLPISNATGPKISAAYVGSSTELVRVEDTDGDGVSDERRIVLSGFGTEDTHHTIHTLRWGPDGRLYFNQSIYIHSHMETPYGMVRLNSGGILAYDPRTERVEVFARGFINTWGHAWDQWGQSFATDGAGFEGVHWIIPGAMYRTYEGARRILPSISPGTYPKYCGLELIQSPLFPEDWQGNAITCDFRAHKITRFQINDLSQPTDGKEPLSGYVTKELPNPVVTSDASFRPIDVKLGPDGALYIADWTNPIINHGEVDFRDPRRDHTNGRIWRLAPKGKEPLKWTALAGKSPKELLPLLNSGSEWAKTHALSELRRALTVGDPRHAEMLSALQEWTRDWDRFRNSSSLLDLHRIQKVDEGSDRTMLALPISNLPAIRAIASRNLSWINIWDTSVNAKLRKPNYIEAPATLARDPNPRVRVEAMRGLAAFHDKEIVPLLLEAALNAPGGAAKQTKSEDKGTNQFNQPTFSDTADPYYGYAAWLSINDLDDVFLKALSEGTWKPDTAEKQQQLAWALGALRPEKAGKGLSDFIARNGLPKDGTGPWIELIGQAGGPGELRILLDGLLANTIPDGDNVPPLADKALAFTNKDANRRAAAALVAAAKRGVKPSNPPYGGWQFHMYAPDEALNDIIRLAGLWKQDVAPALVARIDRDAPKEQLDAIFESLRTLGTDSAAKYLSAFLEPKLAKQIDNQFLNMALEGNQPAIRRRALGSLAAFRPDVSLAFLRPVLEETDSKAQLALWRELFSSEPFIQAFTAKLPELTKEQAAPALRAARELGKRGEKLVAALTPLAGETAVANVPMDVNSLVDMTKKNGNPAEGELIYRRAALTCTVCHAIGGAGGKVGPDLGTIGASAPLDYIIESTVNPAVKVKEGFHAIAASLKDGRTVSGTIAKETDSHLALRDMTGAEQTVEKANIKERTNIGSLMPAGLINTLNDREKANLFAFMSQLGKPGPFDASKSNIARTWRIYPGELVEKVVANKADPNQGIAVHSLVDGRVTKELLEIPLAVAGSNPTVVAAAKFNTVSAAKSRLHLAGITKAWLDGAPLAIASDPNPVVELSAGDHVLVIKLDTAAIPVHFRAEVPEGRFLTE